MVRIDCEEIWERGKLVLGRPRGAWEVIKGEEISIKGVYEKYLVVLAFLSSASVFLSNSVIGYENVQNVVVREGFFSGLILFGVLFLMELFSVYLLSVVLEYIGKSPIFFSKGGREDFFKVVSFSLMPVFIGHFLMFLPIVGTTLGVLFWLYSIYVFFLGVGIILEIGNKIPYIFLSIAVFSLVMSFLSLFS